MTTMTPTQALKRLSPGKSRPIFAWVEIHPLSCHRLARLHCYDGLIHTEQIVVWHDAPACHVLHANLLAAVRGLGEFPPSPTIVDAGTAPRLAVHSASLTVLVGDSLPAIPEVIGTEYSLASLVVSQALNAIDTGQINALSGVCLLGDEARPLSAAGTNGHMLLHAGHSSRHSTAQVCILSRSMAYAIAKTSASGKLTHNRHTTQWHSPLDGYRVCGAAIDGPFPAFRAALDREANAPTVPVAILDYVHASSQGLAKTMKGVVVSPTGSGPLNHDAGGHTVSGRTGIVSPFALNADYCDAIRRLQPTHARLGRGLWLGGKGWEGLIMPLYIPDGAYDFSAAPPLAAPRGKQPATNWKAEALRLRSLLDSAGIKY